MDSSHYKNKLHRLLDKRLFNLRLIFKNYGWLAHHGIERSGSNFLRACLLDLGIDLINKFDLPEGSVSHKHYRWYDDKQKIPSFRSIFYNQNYVKDIEDLNKICSFKKGTKHIVIKKDLFSNVASIANYGLREGWFVSLDEAKSNFENILNDYKNYYSFWGNMQESFPEKVVIISLESLNSSSLELVKALKKLKIEIKIKPPKKFSFDEVRQSNKNRESFFSSEDVKNFLRLSS